MLRRDGYRVLVVDDDPASTALIKIAFVQHEEGARLNTARSAEEAIAYLEAPWPDVEGGSNGLPDVILLDLQMPGMSGAGFLEWYYPQSRVRHVPVVVYSTSGSLALARSCYDLGAAAFLKKPEDFGEFVPAVRRALTHDLDVKRQTGA
jgi:CheY-like chemotaxis protein